MEKIVAMILAGGKGERLYPLTKDRTKPAVPFGGVYRIVDFSLSNCVNSNIRRIYILTQYKSISLNRHVQLAWQILSSRLGEFVQLIPAQQRLDETWYQGTADAIFQNIYTLQEEQPDLVLILSGDHVYKMDYRVMVAYHREKRADLTMAVLEVDKRHSRDFGVVEISPQFRVRGFQEKPRRPVTVPGKPDRILASMGIYAFKTERLVRRLIEDFRNEGSSHDFGRDIIPAMVRKDRVFAFSFLSPETGQPGYWRDVGTLEAYWEANMDLLHAAPELDLHDTKWPIHTYQGTYPPAKTVAVRENKAGVAINSLVSGGCIIGGGVVRSVLSPNVRIEEDAEVEDSILMEGVRIHRGARVRKAIVDKGIHIPARAVIGHEPERDRRRFAVTDSGIVVIPKGREVDR